IYQREKSSACVVSMIVGSGRGMVSRAGKPEFSGNCRGFATSVAIQAAPPYDSRMKRWHLPLVLALSALSPLPAQGEDGGSPFRDKAGELDLSEWLLDRKGFLPVPVLVTEPAVGYGGGMFALFFRQSLREAAMESLKSGRMDPPDIFAVGGLATQNGTWLGAGGGMVSFDEHRYRWRGGIARLNANLDFFGLGGNLPAALAYNADGWASIQQGMMRLRPEGASVCA